MWHYYLFILFLLIGGKCAQEDDPDTVINKFFGSIIVSSPGFFSQHCLGTEEHEGDMQVFCQTVQMICTKRDELENATICLEINMLLEHLQGNDNAMAYVAICGRQDVPSVYCSHLVEESVYQQTRGRPLYMRMVADYAARAASRPAFRELLYDLYDDFNYDGVAGVYLWRDLCLRIPGRWTRKSHFYHDFCKKWQMTCGDAFYCGVADHATLMKRAMRHFFSMCRPHATGPEREYCAKFLIPSFESLEVYVDALSPETFAVFAQECQLQQLHKNYSPLCRRDHTKLINCYKAMEKECSANGTSLECKMLRGAYYGNP
ncbi:unnamed protein product, partial [Mesorhabditis spiculigera]